MAYGVWLVSIIVTALVVRRIIRQNARIRLIRKVSASLSEPGFRYRSDEEVVAVVRFIQRGDYDAALKILTTERDYT
jgi:hypothetical protein